MNEKYNSAKEWRKANYRKLKQYRGEWIIYTKDGVIAQYYVLYRSSFSVIQKFIFS